MHYSHASAEQLLAEPLPPKILLIGSAGSAKSSAALALATKHGSSGGVPLPVISIRQQLNPRLLKLCQTTLQTVNNPFPPSPSPSLQRLALRLEGMG